MRCLRSMLLLLPFLSTPVYPQTPTMDVFCNAGLRPDGYVDLAAMPKAPNFPSAEQGSANSDPFTVTLPIIGIAGLTVQVTIPALAGLQAGPIYSVTNGTLLLNGFAAAEGANMTLTFRFRVSGWSPTALAVTGWTNRPALHLTSEHEYRAYYLPGSDSVHMPARSLFVDAPHYYSTLFHELVHSTGHESRLHRSFGAGFGDELYSNEN